MKDTQTHTHRHTWTERRERHIHRHGQREGGGKEREGSRNGKEKKVIVGKKIYTLHVHTQHYAITF